MSEFEEWWRRTRRLFDEIDKLFDELTRGSFEGITSGQRRIIGPYYYGFSVTIGPDGVPKVREWGNIKPGTVRPRVSDTVEPFVDVIEEEENLRIIVDMPGVEKEDIQLESAETEITVSAERGDRKYFKVIKLPARVKPDSAKAQYKNGVLTIVLEKLEKDKKSKGFKVRIE